VPSRAEGGTGLPWLDQANDVAIGIPDTGDHGAATDILGRLMLGGAGREEFLEPGVDVLDLSVTDGAGEAAGVAAGVEAELLVTDLELHVVG